MSEEDQMMRAIAMSLGQEVSMDQRSDSPEVGTHFLFHIHTHTYTHTHMYTQALVRTHAHMHARIPKSSYALTACCF